MTPHNHEKELDLLTKINQGKSQRILFNYFNIFNSNKRAATDTSTSCETIENNRLFYVGYSVRYFSGYFFRLFSDIFEIISKNLHEPWVKIAWVEISFFDLIYDILVLFNWWPMVELFHQMKMKMPDKFLVIFLSIIVEKSLSRKTFSTVLHFSF